MTDHLDQLAETERDITAFAGGELELTPIDDPDEAAAAVAQLPFPDAPHNVIRPLRLPYDIDAQVRHIAEERGMTISAVYRDLIVAGLEAVDDVEPDPVTQLNRHLEAAQRAVNELTANRHRDAA